MTWSLEAAAVCGALGAVAGLAVPRLVRAIPEPADEVEEVDEADVGAPDNPVRFAASLAPPDSVVEEPKELYADIAAGPGLRARSVVVCALAAALLGAALGWDAALLPALPLVPVGFALAVVDWRTRLLPTWLIAPTYAVVVVACLGAAVVERSAEDLVRAGWGWAVAGGAFLLLWLVYPRGMGYGDVRLSGVLGIVLGYLGWGPLLIGVYAGFLLGGLGGGLLSLLGVVRRKAYPFGPFMLLGALLGAVVGGPIATWYLGRL